MNRTVLTAAAVVIAGVVIVLMSALFAVTQAQRKVAVQYAQRCKLGDLDVEGIRALRARSVEEMAQKLREKVRERISQKQKTTPAPAVKT